MKGRADREFRHPSEALALRYLRDRGHVLLRHNYHLRFVEIDLITAHAGRVHFTEVKHWTRADFRHPLETLTEKRKRDSRRGARAFLREMALHAETRAAYFQSFAGETPHTEINPDEIAVSFNLVWLKSAGDPEFFADVF